MYGPDVREHGTFAHNCLIARRLVERGVRFVQLMHAGWDQHGNLFTQLEQQCNDTDRPVGRAGEGPEAARLLDDTLVVWGGEFGRTPFGQGDRRQPNGPRPLRHGLQLWLAGGGVKPGTSTARPTTSRWNIADDPVHVHDIQATILHLLRHRPHAADVPLPGPAVSA